MFHGGCALFRIVRLVVHAFVIQPGCWSATHGVPEEEWNERLDEEQLGFRFRFPCALYARGLMGYSDLIDNYSGSGAFVLAGSPLL